MRCWPLTIAILAILNLIAVTEGAMNLENLRCEYLTDPLGIIERQPRLSWVLRSDKRGSRQTAYRVLVASSLQKLTQDQGDLWDSGKVASDDTTAIVYAGRALASNRPAYWKAQAWDQDGQPTAWSAPAMWSMGLLDPAEWKAAWIGYDAPRELELPEAPFEEAKWVAFAADPLGNAPAGNRLFVTTMELPKDAKIRNAKLIVAADDASRFVINGTLVGQTTGWQVAREIDVAPQLRPGTNHVRVEVNNAIPRPAGLIARILVTTEDGKTHRLLTSSAWKSTDKSGDNWHSRDIDTTDWPASRELGVHGVQPWGKVKLYALRVPPVSFLRTAFATDKPVRRAMLYATALGNIDMHLNGQRVSEDYFTPGWTDYTRRVYYRTFDVTASIRSGQNVLGAALADGWYSGHIGWGQLRDHYGKKPRLAAQLHIEYADGSTAVVTTDNNWRASTGPILEGDFLMGEVHDARKELPGWDAPGFDDSAWAKVDVGAEMKPLIQPHPGPAIRPIGLLQPAEIKEVKPGVWVLNYGQNFAGVPRLTITGEKGQKITLRFAERLNPDGTIYTTNLRGARATDTYMCKGGGVEVWQPRFTFHGYQYAEITGLKSAPTPDTLVGVALSSDTPIAGSFECSDAMLNRLAKNVFWTQVSNFIDIPTDCPQRDERLGWTGDAQVYIRTATLNTDVQAFFTKWLVDLADSQRADGQFPMVAPVKVAGDDGGPSWADAGVICPWTLYEVYGDRRILERHYEGMTKFIEFCRKRSTAELLPPEKYHCFGDWLSINADTPKDVIYTAYFACSTKLTAKTAEVLGKTDDAAKYHKLFDQIAAAFNKAYVAEDGRINGNTQCCYVLAIAFDLLDEAKLKLAAKYLVEDIESRGGHLSTGFIGTKDLMLALAKIGRNDVAYRLLHNDTFPSWGFSIRHGATSIWERWDGWTPEKGFQDPGMNSFAHYSFGAVYQWMAENIAGIRSDGVGYNKILIAPQPGGKLTWARTGYTSIHGRIETDWKRDAGQFHLTVTIPANTTATVHLPAIDGPITESGKAIEQADGVKLVSRDAGRAILAVGSGTYRFVSRMK